MRYYLNALSNYTNFNGRASRSEYWFFALYNTIFSFFALRLDKIFEINFDDEIGYGPLTAIYSIAMVIPSLAISVRRLHDVGKSGWMFLISFVPFIGSVWLLVLLLSKSEKEQNQYGDLPKSISASNGVSITTQSLQNIIFIYFIYIFFWQLIRWLIDLSVFDYDVYDYIGIINVYFYIFIGSLLESIINKTQRVIAYLILLILLYHDIYTLIIV